LEEILKHRGLKDKEHHHHHHHMHLFHFPGHHHHHKENQQNQNVTVEKYREISSAIDEPSNASNSSSTSAAFKLKITVGRIDEEMNN
jgi:hypothetical protein